MKFNKKDILAYIIYIVKLGKLSAGHKECQPSRGETEHIRQLMQNPDFEIMKNEIERAMDLNKNQMRNKVGIKCDLKSPVGLAEEGDRCLKQKQYAAAMKYYTQAINMCVIPNNLLYVKRAYCIVELTGVLSKTGFEYQRV